MIELGQISWVEPEELMAALSKPFASGSNLKKDPSQMAVRIAKRQGPLVTFLNFLFRFSEKRNKDAQMQELMTKFRPRANAYVNRPHHRPPHSVRCATAAGFYSHLPKELWNTRWPNVVVLMQKGMVHPGTAMLRHAYCNGRLKSDGALILTTVKNMIYLPGGEGDALEVRAFPNGAMVVAYNSNGYFLMQAVLPRMGDEARKLYLNNFADPPAPATISPVELCRQLAPLIEFENVDVGGGGTSMWTRCPCTSPCRQSSWWIWPGYTGPASAWTHATTCPTAPRPHVLSAATPSSQLRPQ